MTVGRWEQALAAVRRAGGQAAAAHRPPVHQTDLDAHLAMLTRAGIPYEVDVNDRRELPRPDGATSVWVHSSAYSASRALRQPHPGGYTGFTTETVFTPEGALWAVWAWE